MDNQGRRTLRSVRPQEPIRLPVEPKKGKTVFWWIYGGIFLVLFIALGVFLIILNNFLTAYEASQPIHEAQALFDKCFADEEFTEAFRLSGFAAEGFDDTATVAAALRASGEGKDLVFYQAKAEEGKACFNVIYADPVQEEEENEEGSLSHRSASQKIATMTFSHTGKELGFNFKGWELESLEMELSGTDSVTVTVPRGYKVTLNGRDVSEDYLVSSEASPNNDFLPDGVEGIYWDKYHVEGLYGAGQVMCTDAEGKMVTVTRVDKQTEPEDPDGPKEAVYRADLNYNAELQAQYGDFVRQGMEAYAAYIQDDGGIGAVAKYFDTDSLFYKNTRLNPQQWVISHKGYYFENETVDRFYAYNDEIFSCRVILTQVLTQYGGGEERYPMAKTVFLHKVNGQFRIFDSTNEVDKT